MITRDEFDELAGEAISAGGNMASAMEWGEGVQSSFDAAGKAKDDLMAAFDTMNKRIAELEAERATAGLVEMAKATITIRALAKRIAELEAQVSAWPRVPEADEERDKGAFIEAPAVLDGVNLLDEAAR